MQPLGGTIMKNFLIIVGLVVAGLLGFGVYRQMTSVKNVVVIYTPHPADFVEGINKRFEAQYPEIKVQMVRAKTTELEDRIRSEKANPMGDVMFGGDVGTYIQMKRNSLIQPATLTAAKQLPADMQDKEGYWFAPYRYLGIFFYNNTLVTPEQAPKDWDDILQPNWKSAIMFLNPTQSGTARTFFISLMSVWGEGKAFDYFKKLDTQLDGKYVASPDKMFGSIARGEAKVGLWLEADILKFITHKKMPFGIVYPSSGTYMCPEPIAVIKNAPHADAAQKYMNFVFENDALEFAANAAMKRPTKQDFPKDKLPAPLQTTPKAFPIDWSAIGDKGTAWLQKWSEEVWHKKS
jgi:iron(III) transport system substrate-binding protein